MYKNKKIIGIIPARGGSKGLPRKNIKNLCGKPLIAWTIEQARACSYFDEIFVSTDSIEIAKVAETFGVKVQFLRPEHLATDSSTSVDVVLHVLDHYEKIEIFFDYLVLLEPTSPLRKPENLDEIIKLAVNSTQADGVISVGEVHMEHPLIVKKISEDGMLVPYVESTRNVTRRQEVDKAYFPYGVAYMIKTSAIRTHNSFYTGNIVPYCLERWQSYEIDDIYDYACVQEIFRQKGGLDE